ncbi:GNAT family N-acetyltransferase [Thermopolyspora sp. NPDC052614]|uniref:GNAT family N-acetyltransferase n=1 Tax=Thermopolyspora sp. NPDC052614 TaxID=3155682 RepID=UPI003426DD9D
MHRNTVLDAVRQPLSLTLRRAESADLPAALALLAEAAAWLNDRGVRQWPVGGFPASRIEPLIAAGTLYVLEAGSVNESVNESDKAAGLGDLDAGLDAGLEAGLGGAHRDGVGGPAIVATMALDGFADPEFWTADDRPETAYYVHKLCTSRACAGLGLGRTLLDWATLRALADGMAWLRLDCAKTNAGLQGYYRSLGFRHVRTVDLPHRASGALFQRPATLTAGYVEAPTAPVAPGHPAGARVIDLTVDLAAEAADAASDRDLVLTR